jgi:peptidoglycan/LPS O-acetylase OafA/YrhL
VTLRHCYVHSPPTTGCDVLSRARNQWWRDLPRPIPDCLWLLAFAVAELAAFTRTQPSAKYCAECVAPAAAAVVVLAAWLDTRPILNARVRPRRVPLLGPEACE